MPGLAPDTMVATPAGPRPVAELQAGDLVQTADHGPLPILWQGRVHAPDVGRFRSARLLAPYFGLYRDLVVQPSQRLALSGVDVEYHFGEEEVLVEARHLVNGETAVWDDGGDVAACHGLLLDRHALISANGIWTETLYFARIARNPELARTTAPAALGGMKELPVHDRPARRELLDFEALALNAARLRSRSPLVA